MEMVNGSQKSVFVFVGVGYIRLHWGKKQVVYDVNNNSERSQHLAVHLT